MVNNFYTSQNLYSSTDAIIQKLERYAAYLQKQLENKKSLSFDGMDGINQDILQIKRDVNDLKG